MRCTRHFLVRSLLPAAGNLVQVKKRFRGQQLFPTNASLFTVPPMTEKQNRKIAIITGANAGVGYGIMQRLLEAFGQEITIVMACRNHARASRAREQILQELPFADIDIELVDISRVESVFTFCQAIVEK